MAENCPFFSIIIPVYNCEKYIQASLNSVLAQTDQSTEVLVIDDGSVDNTVKNVRKFQDARVKVICKHNSGVSESRNRGIQEARGEYILFLDADDEFSDKQALELLHRTLTQNPSDVTIFGFEVAGIVSGRQDDSSLLNDIVRIDSSFELRQTIIKAIFNQRNGLYGYVWRACYKRSMLIEQKIVFNIGMKIFEDQLFLLQSVFASKRIAVMNQTFYRYIINAGSMSIKYIGTFVADISTLNLWASRHVLDEDQEFRKTFESSIVEAYLRCVQNELRNSDSTIFQKMKKIRLARKQLSFQNHIKRVRINRKNFDTKSCIGLYLLKYHCELLYSILFYLKQRC